MQVLVTVVCESTKVARVTTVTCTYFDSMIMKTENIEFYCRNHCDIGLFLPPSISQENHRAAKTPPFTPNRARLINI